MSPHTAPVMGNREDVMSLFLNPEAGERKLTSCKLSVKVIVAQSSLTLQLHRTVVCQAPLAMGFSEQEYWSG